MRSKILSLLLTLLIPAVVWGQSTRCYTMEYLEYLKSQDPGLESRMEQIESDIQNWINFTSTNRNADDVFVIPVVVHVIYHTASQNISDAMINSQIRVLNEDYRKMLGTPGHNDDEVGANTNIVFRLASVDPDGNPTNGVTRTETTVSSFTTNNAMKYTASGGHDAWNSSKYLNIWTCNMTGGILGYAQFPGGNPATDGVVILYSAFGYNSPAFPYNKGRTTTHEIGHWINLRHIWGDGGCGVDDFVPDTPLSDAANFGCPVGHVSCGSVDMIENYMDYTDDTCMNIFTDGQTTRMVATLATTRASLFTDPTFDTQDFNITVAETPGPRTIDAPETVTFGFDPGATDGVEWILGEAEMSTTIESGYFDARFVLPGGTDASLMDFRSTSETSATWELIFQTGSGSYPIQFEWDQNAFPTGNFIMENTSGTISIDLKAQSSYQLTDSGVNKFYIYYTQGEIPVEFTSFTANVNGPSITLNWSTATETNNQGFEVERKAEGASWSRIGAVEGHGTTSEANSYSFSDYLGNVNSSAVQYRLKQIDFDGSYSYSEVIEAAVVPSQLALEQNYPNPFNPSTTIRFTLPSESNVSLVIFNSIGEKVAELLNDVKQAGFHEVNFDASGMTSGIYFYEIQSSPVDPAAGQSFREIKKMTLLK